VLVGSRLPYLSASFHSSMSVCTNKNNSESIFPPGGVSYEIKQHYNIWILDKKFNVFCMKFDVFLRLFLNIIKTIIINKLFSHLGIQFFYFFLYLLAGA
jgi:hypothetical protein